MQTTAQATRQQNTPTRSERITHEPTLHATSLRGRSPVIHRTPRPRGTFLAFRRSYSRTKASPPPHTTMLASRRLTANELIGTRPILAEQKNTHGMSETKSIQTSLQSVASACMEAMMDGGSVPSGGGGEIDHHIVTLPAAAMRRALVISANRSILLRREVCWFGEFSRTQQTQRGTAVRTSLQDNHCDSRPGNSESFFTREL